MPSREHEPGEEGSDTDQHGKSVVIEVPGLQPHHVAGHVEHTRGHAVRAEPVDDEPVAALPEEPADPQRRANEHEVVDTVEVPSVEQELVEQALLTRQTLGNVAPSNIELPGDEKSAGHHHRGKKLDGKGNALYILKHMVVR